MGPLVCFGWLAAMSKKLRLKPKFASYAAYPRLTYSRRVMHQTHDGMSLVNIRLQKIIRWPFDNNLSCAWQKFLTPPLHCRVKSTNRKFVTTYKGDVGSLTHSIIAQSSFIEKRPTEVLVLRGCRLKESRALWVTGTRLTNK